MLDQDNNFYMYLISLSIVLIPVCLLMYGYFKGKFHVSRFLELKDR